MGDGYSHLPKHPWNKVQEDLPCPVQPRPSGFSLRKWNCERKEGKGKNAGPEVGGLRDEPKERLRRRLLKFYPGETFPSPESPGTHPFCLPALVHHHLT